MTQSSGFTVIRALQICALVSCLALAGAQTDTDILNLALQLECLEGQFYTCAALGPGNFDPSLLGGGPAATPCIKASLSNETLVYASELSRNENAHIADLRAVLGSAAVPCPAIELNASFISAANAALGAPLNPPYSPYASNINFLLAGFMFEAVGQSAYLGAAGLFKSTSNLVTAMSIGYVEAIQTGVVNGLLFDFQQDVLPYGDTVAQFTQSIAGLENKVDASIEAQGIVSSSGGTLQSVLAPVDRNAQAFSRTPAQVLAILTQGSTTGTGGFLPKGLNGFFGPAAAPPTSAAGR